MNKFDELCSFKFADIDDTKQIMKFIYDFWSKNHILANDEQFFLYEFQNNNKLNFLIARDKLNQIQAIMGFFPYSLEEIQYQTDYSGALLKVKDDCNIPLLGIEMVRRFLDLKKIRAYIGNGSNPKTALPWQKNVLKHFTGKLEHYYRLNNNKKQYSIANIQEKEVLKIDFSHSENIDFIKCVDVDNLLEQFKFDDFKDKIPYKDKSYVKKRYKNHPIYNYIFFAIKINNNIDTILVARDVLCNGAKILRIVDILGDFNQIRHIGAYIQELLILQDYEYIDIYQYGISEDILNEAGFINKNKTPNNIIPNYFEPFVSKNIDIYFHTTSKNACIFKADGDQDRPSMR